MLINIIYVITSICLGISLIQLFMNIYRTIVSIIIFLDGLNDETKPSHIKSEVFKNSKYILKNQLIIMRRNILISLLIICSCVFVLTFTNCKSCEKSNITELTNKWNQKIDSLGIELNTIQTNYQDLKIKYDSLLIESKNKDSLIITKDDIIKTYSGLKQENINLRNAIEHQNQIIKQWGIK